MRSWCSRLVAESSIGLSAILPRAVFTARTVFVARTAAVAIVFFIFATTAVHAQSAPDPEDNAPHGVFNTTGIAMPPAAGEASNATIVTQDATSSVPPAPIVSPLVGPPIKQSYADEVDKRTTAFIPTSIEELNLTPIEMPATDENWVRVDLSEQLLVAYSGDRMVRAFVIASGLPGTETVTGEFRIRMKVRSQTMSGGVPGTSNYYNLPNVQWVQYFYADYGLHGTYWHNSFGTPRSHGCINMTNADAKWMWDFLSPVWDGSTVWQRTRDDEQGSLVIVHE